MTLSFMVKSVGGGEGCLWVGNLTAGEQKTAPMSEPFFIPFFFSTFFLRISWHLR
jgi:hypothetical protein